MTELLVVIAIISLLAAILVPAIGMVKALANATVCGNNLRQVGLAIYAYTAENENIFPTGYTDFKPRGSWAYGYVSWDDLLSDYDGRNLSLNQMLERRIDNTSMNPKFVKAYAVYRCPAENYVNPGAANRYLRTYAVNRAWSGTPSQNEFTQQVGGIYATAQMLGLQSVSDWAAPLGQIRRPSQTIMLTELRYVFAWLGSELGIFIDNPFSGPQGVANSPRMGHVNADAIGNAPGWKILHGNSWNYLFCDGHVEKLRPEQTVSTGIPLNGPVDANSMWNR